MLRIIFAAIQKFSEVLETLVLRCVLCEILFFLIQPVAYREGCGGGGPPSSILVAIFSQMVLHYEAKLCTGCVCMFSHSRNKSLNMLNLCRNDQKNERTKEDQRERPCCRIRIHFPKAQFWPRNVPLGIYF